MCCIVIPTVICVEIAQSCNHYEAASENATKEIQQHYKPASIDIELTIVLEAASVKDGEQDEGDKKGGE